MSSRIQALWLAEFPAASLSDILFGVGLIVLSILSLVFYGRKFARLLAGNGKVWTEPFGLPDVMVVTVLATWLGGVAVQGFLKPSEPDRVMSNSDIVANALLFGFIVGGISLFLRSRKIVVSQLFGLRELSPFQVITQAIGFLLAAYPLVNLGAVAMQSYMGDDSQEQEILQFFSDAAHHSQWIRVIGIAGTAIFVAPIGEEFLFRGYIYGVLRRNLGVVPALLLNAGLFAAIHVNLTALPSLAILAVCLTLAYEATGSLLVPMVMHALFNLVTLGAVFSTPSP